MPKSIRSRASLQSHIIRLEAGDDVKSSLERYVRDQDIHASFLMSAVGGLAQVSMRLPGGTEPITMVRDLELLALTGTLSQGGSSRLNIAVADETGRVWGGQLMAGCLVKNTVELVLGEPHGVVFSRLTDPATGYRELEWI